MDYKSMSRVLFAIAFAALLAAFGRRSLAQLSEAQCIDLNSHINECLLAEKLVSNCNEKNVNLFIDNVHEHRDCQFISYTCQKHATDQCDGVQQFYENACPEMQELYKKKCQN
jgi:hypothetical protein